MDVRVGLLKKLSTEELMAFELWSWRRLLRVPWAARRSNQSILKEISPGCSLERLMLKLTLQYFGHLMWRADSLEKTLMLGKRLKARGEGDSIGWDGWMASLTQWTWVSRNWGWTGRPGVLQSMGLKRVRLDWSTELNWIVLSDLMHVLYYMQCLKQLKSSILCHQFATTWLFVVSLLLYVSVYVFNRLYAFISSNHKITWVDTYRELNYSIVSQVVWKCFNIMSRRMPYVNQRQDTKNQQY